MAVNVMSSSPKSKSSETSNHAPSLLANFLLRCCKQKQNCLPMKHTCDICFDLKTNSDMFQTTKCNHFYCLDCICKYVTFQINNNLVKVKVITCPSPNCSVKLKPKQLQHILPKQVTFRWESLIHKSSIPFKLMSYGRKLIQNIELDMKFLELAKRESWKKCPRCSFYVERINGCNHMMCRCGCDFCYNCGSGLRKKMCGCD
ncbi:putative transcription factor C2H2 family [Medicago truncatula]|uniref:IBR domain protein n=1 Tax=Medicago truncatula TaxID=3880 RepID=G7J052_MEDTR|nr:IBR domain protein [Medicago truncatula]RHN67218.1 putative transcription factor C2H2 family [Medicago truncatula]